MSMKGRGSANQNSAPPSGRLRAPIDPGTVNSLGLRIVGDLVRAGLDGTFALESRDGTLATVLFPRE